MARPSNAALIWRLRWLARRGDWLSMVGIALAVLAMGLYLVGVRPMEARRVTLTDRVVQLQAHADTQPQGAVQPRPQAQLAAFYDRLEDARQAPEITSKLHSYLRSAGLALERGDYRPLPDASGKFVRYHIVLPVNGSYLQVRRFLADAMRDVPGLALDAISFERDHGNSTQVQAQLLFTAFLRKSP